MSIPVRIEWDEWSVEHIADHGVSLRDVEEVCAGDAYSFKGRRGAKVVLGQTFGGAYLFIVLRVIEKGVAKCVTARPMSQKEKRLYRKRKGRR